MFPSESKIPRENFFPEEEGQSPLLPGEHKTIREYKFSLCI